MKAIGFVGVVIAMALLPGCGGNPDEAIIKADAASGEKLQTYSENITEAVDIAGNADLVQRFCKNGLGGPCPADITTTLKTYGFAGSGVDLAHAFTQIVADMKDGEADFSSSDEDYLDAAYHVALGRDPDTGGAQDNLRLIQDTGERKTMLRSLLQSAEFKKQQ